MTTEALIWLSGLTIAVLGLAGVVIWMLWHYSRGMEAAEVWLDELWEPREPIVDAEGNLRTLTAYSVEDER